MTNARLKAIMILFLSASPLGSLIRLFMLVLEYLHEHYGPRPGATVGDDMHLSGNNSNSTVAAVLKYVYEFMTPFFISHQNQHQPGQYRVEHIPQTGIYNSLASLYFKHTNNNNLHHHHRNQLHMRQFTPRDILRTVLHHHAIPMGSSTATYSSSSSPTTTASSSSSSSSSSLPLQETIIQRLNQDLEMVLPWIFAFTALIIIPFSMIVIHALMRRGDMENERKNRKIQLYTLCLEAYCKVLTKGDIIKLEENHDYCYYDDENDDSDIVYYEEANDDVLDDSQSPDETLQNTIIIDVDDGDQNTQENIIDNSDTNDGRNIEESKSVIEIYDDSDNDDDENHEAQEEEYSQNLKGNKMNLERDEHRTTDRNNAPLIVIDDDDDDDRDDDDDENKQALIHQTSCTSTPKAANNEQKIEAEECTIILLPKPGNTQKQMHPYRQVSGTCSICLEPYEIGEKVVWSSFIQCPHVFHYDCIATWVKKRGNSSCPCCRRDFIDTGLCRQIKRNSVHS